MRSGVVRRRPARCSTSWPLSCRPLPSPSRVVRPGETTSTGCTSSAAAGVTSTPCTHAAVRSTAIASRRTTSATAVARSSGVSGAVAATYAPRTMRRTVPSRIIRSRAERSTPAARAIARVNGRSSGRRDSRVLSGRVWSMCARVDRTPRCVERQSTASDGEAPGAYQGTTVSSARLAAAGLQRRSSLAASGQRLPQGRGHHRHQLVDVQGGDRFDLQHVAHHRQPDQLRADELDPHRGGLHAGGPAGPG